MNNSKDKLGLVALTAVVISAMVGGGVFNLPQNIAESAGAAAIIIAWCITGIGMWFLVNTFRILSVARPEAKTGIYTYGEMGFGKFTGFLAAWGYWLSACFANIGYIVLVMSSLNHFFPGYFKGGNNFNSVIGGSLLIWIIFLIVSYGIKEASTLNMIGTIWKIVSVAILIFITAFAFKITFFISNFWGEPLSTDIVTKPLGSILEQVKGTMFVTLWVFIGIEGAVVISDKAKNQRDVGKATLLGFLTCLILYIIVSLLPMGRYTQSQLSVMSAPSSAEVLGGIIGKLGNTLMDIGVLVSVLTSFLIWTVMLSELPFAAGIGGSFPKAFKKTNKKETPIFSLLISCIFMQIILMLVYFSSNAWNLLLNITGVMILPCYIVSTLYLIKIAVKNENFPTDIFITRKKAAVVGILGAVYGFWLIYAAELKYMLVATVVYALGIPLFIKARKDFNSKDGITKKEKIFMNILLVIGIIGVIYLIKNYQSLI